MDNSDFETLISEIKAGKLQQPVGKGITNNQFCDIGKALIPMIGNKINRKQFTNFLGLWKTRIVNECLYPNMEKCIKSNIAKTIQVGDVVRLIKSNDNTSNIAVLFKPSNKICIPNPKQFGLIPLEDYNDNGTHKYDSDLDIDFVIKR